MSASFMEIVELPNGDFALKRMDEDDRLVTISFSAEAKAFLQDNNQLVAHAMINAGMEAVGMIVSNEERLEAEETNKTIH